MKDFLSITTYFDPRKERSVSELSQAYNDVEKLRNTIKKLIEPWLKEEHVKGKKVLLKPNWVTHSWKEQDEICLRTNDGFILATLKLLLAMGPSEVLIGDAPIQGCVWEKMLSDFLIEGIKNLSAEFGIPIQLKDFRRRTYSFTDNEVVTEKRPLSDYLIFDLGSESMIEPITREGKSGFRVTNYDPDRMVTAHSPGVHKYCITKDYFDAELVISLPKIKTHQKTGITGALKNLVGINGDKDFLPHHRIGGTDMGGDCYPGRSYLRYWSELLLDRANRRQGTKSFWWWQKFSALLWKMSLPGAEHQVAAGWWGNNTSWRMVMDLNKIAVFGDSTGQISSTPQRMLFSLCDGIVGGQGDGPLEPDPLALGIISFTNNSMLNDRAMAHLMGLPIEKLPLLNHQGPAKEVNDEILLNGEPIEMEELKSYRIEALPPRGWMEHLKTEE